MSVELVFNKKQHNAAIFQYMIDMWVDNGIELCVHINTRIWHEDQSMSDVVRYTYIVCTLYWYVCLWFQQIDALKVVSFMQPVYAYIYIMLIHFYFDERSDCLTEVAEMTRTLIEHLNLII